MFEDLLDIKTCECGRDHTLLTREYVIEENAYAALPVLLEKLKFKSNILAVYDQNTQIAAQSKISAALPGAVSCILQGDAVHPDEERVDETLRAINESHPDVVLAVGGGVVCDIVRYATFQANIPFIAVPTAASVDGYVSGAAAMSFNGAKISLTTHAPVAVVADLRVIASAPKKLAASGVGDMLAKFISIADWKIGHLISGEYYCPFIAKIGQESVESIVQYLPDIKEGGIEGTRKLIEGLLLSGIAMQMAGITRSASSFEHHFSHYLEVVPVPGVDKDALHGEKVGIGTVIAAKYYPLLAESLRPIFVRKLQNKFDINKAVSYYAQYPKGLIDMIRKENTPTCTDALDPALLEKNWEEIQQIAHSLPTAEQMAAWLSSLGGYYDYRQIGLSEEGCLEALKICVYIRNRFTMLRIVRDFEVFAFDALLI